MVLPHKPQLLFDVLFFMGEESLKGWAFLLSSLPPLPPPLTSLASGFQLMLTKG